MWEYQAAVERVVDGDTARFLIDNGMYIRSSQSIRFAGVNAPELSQPGGPEARTFVIDWVHTHTFHVPLSYTWPFIVVTEKDRLTFNRYIGVVRCATCNDQLNAAVNQHLGP